MEKMKVAIIGGSGFIGSRLVKRLINRSELDIVIIDKRPSDSFPELHRYGDITEPHTLLPALRRCDVVINLAAEHQDNIEPIDLYYKVNADGASNLCSLASQLNIQHIIFTSSVAVYGSSKNELSESSETNPLNHYGKSKLEAELIYKYWAKSNISRKLTIIRPTVVFGEDNRGNVYNLFNQIVTGRFIMIGNGNNVKSMAYVENVAARLEYSLEQASNIQVSNYSDKPDMTMNQLVEKISTLAEKRRVKARVPYFFGIAVATILDITSKITSIKFPVSRVRVIKFCSQTKIKNEIETGFTPPVDMSAALEETVKYEFK
ncbi:NAD-dependent epimerase/dehydratase family protein [Serratia quinivorans]|uniref:NAD-dependent epimerase/dehydratase family protein n=1 Tax=Serratia quinivorans TaxID=137545 RepID=UPI001C495238|nr:NAD(P)-dependent oxidoreductase [Serratia quinivorans]MBV6693119.1 NAD(P)-dependent oxidoreductase [Serratia quinivorans]